MALLLPLLVVVVGSAERCSSLNHSVDCCTLEACYWSTEGASCHSVEATDSGCPRDACGDCDGASLTIPPALVVAMILSGLVLLLMLGLYVRHHQSLQRAAHTEDVNSHSMASRRPLPSKSVSLRAIEADSVPSAPQYDTVPVASEAKAIVYTSLAPSPRPVSVGQSVVYTALPNRSSVQGG